MIYKNPIDSGCYADPEARFYNGKYYIYVTRSLPFKEQMNQDCFSSEDLVNFEKHESIIDMSGFPWITNAVWAPTIIEKAGKYYYVFASNNIQKSGEIGGLEIAVSDKPEGPFKAYLDKPLVGDFVNGAQPIDAHLYKDDDGKIYLLFGGWGHCNIALMNDSMDGFEKIDGENTFMEITPKDYVEGPCMFKRNGLYYFMWSSGGWTDGTYRVVYSKSESILGPYDNEKVVLSAQEIADGPGHHGYLELSKDPEKWVIVYHRRTVGDKNPHHRYLCIDKMEFDGDDIKPIIMT